jgi:hypothetical protein
LNFKKLKPKTIVHLNVEILRDFEKIENLEKFKVIRILRFAIFLKNVLLITKIKKLEKLIEFSKMRTRIGSFSILKIADDQLMRTICMRYLRNGEKTEMLRRNRSCLWSSP